MRRLDLKHYCFWNFVMKFIKKNLVIFCFNLIKWCFYILGTKFQIFKNMVDRKSNEILDQLAQTFKVVAITGPSQSGKATLVKAFSIKRSR